MIYGVTVTTRLLPLFIAFVRDLPTKNKANFYENLFRRGPVVPYIQTDRHDEDNSNFP
jgi:hypothetical protein